MSKAFFFLSSGLWATLVAAVFLWAALCHDARLSAHSPAAPAHEAPAPEAPADSLPPAPIIAAAHAMR